MKRFLLIAVLGCGLLAAVGGVWLVTVALVAANTGLVIAIRARALIEGRFAPSVDDVAALAQPVLRHRMALSFAARAEGVQISEIIDRLCRSHL